MPMLTLLECGLSTAFASGIDATQAAIVEEKSVLFRYETFIGSDFQPQLCAFRDNSRIGEFAPRLRELVQEATADLVARISALDAISSYLYGRRAKLVIVLPEIDDASGLDRISLSSLGRDLIDEMCSSLSNDIGLIISETVIRAAGHAGVGSAVADHLIEPSPEHADIVLVAAVDSYNDRQRLNRLNDQKRLFTKQNQFGFVPGEAAGILLFKRQTATMSSLQLLGAGHMVESVKEDQEADSVFTALSEAAFTATEMALKNSNERSISAWIADWNNSRYRATELSFAIHRLNAACLQEGLSPVYPALQFGDVGAAYGCLAIILARSARSFPSIFSVDHAEASAAQENTFLVSAGSAMSGLRSAMVLSTS